MQDSLFEVSLKTLSLHPVFWAHRGPRVSVLRGSWFVTDETRPCSWELGEALERAYLEIKPWLVSFLAQESEAALMCSHHTRTSWQLRLPLEQLPKRSSNTHCPQSLVKDSGSSLRTARKDA